MTENVIEIVEISDALPLKHQFGKLLFGTIVAFAATKLADKVYLTGLDKIHAMKQSQIVG